MHRILIAEFRRLYRDLGLAEDASEPLRFGNYEVHGAPLMPRIVKVQDEKGEFAEYAGNHHTT